MIVPTWLRLSPQAYNPRQNGYKMLIVIRTPLFNGDYHDPSRIPAPILLPRSILDLVVLPDSPIQVGDRVLLDEVSVLAYDDYENPTEVTHIAPVGAVLKGVVDGIQIIGKTTVTVRIKSVQADAAIPVAWLTLPVGRGLPKPAIALSFTLKIILFLLAFILTDSRILPLHDLFRVQPPRKCPKPSRPQFPQPHIPPWRPRTPPLIRESRDGPIAEEDF